MKMYKRHEMWTTFGSANVEKWHATVARRIDVEKAGAVAARSTFPSQNAKNIEVSDHFWRDSCPKTLIEQID